MSDDTAEAPAPKKKGGKLKKMILFVGLPLVLIGAGVGGGLYAAGGTKKEGAHEDPNRPKLMLKSEGGEHGSGKAYEGPEPKHPDPAKFQSTYFPIEQTFTSNLHDTDGFLQLTLGVSTFYDSKVIDNLKDTEMPVRSAVLDTLAQQDAEALNTPQGKLALRKALAKAINQVLEQREGFGGIDDVYFTSFVIQ